MKKVLVTGSLGVLDHRLFGRIYQAFTLNGLGLCISWAMMHDV